VKTAFAGAKIELRLVTTSDDGLSCVVKTLLFDIDELSAENFLEVHDQALEALKEANNGKAAAKKPGPQPGFKKKQVAPVEAAPAENPVEQKTE
jgi:hypothetical protein